jgi:hypothetical protein
VAPLEAEPGDVVAILLGSTVPVLLRPGEQGMYSVLGEAYIHGIMYGEGLEQLGKNSAEPVVLKLA